ncbi:hypothetical protein ACFSYD_17295 [Paracoccus aerius]
MTLRDALTGISGILVTPFDAEDRIAPPGWSRSSTARLLRGCTSPS